MDESAKFDLEQRVRLYEFYIGCYIKGIGFYLAITGALLKFALDSDEHRGVFSTAGIMTSAPILIPLVFGIMQERTMKAEFLELSKSTNTKLVSTAPLRMLSAATAVFWVIILSGWFYIKQIP